MMNVFTSSGLSGGADDDWVENDDRVLIVLTGTRIASAAETFVDMSHSVENVLIIGENTAGMQVASAAYSIQLPNSRCFVTMGDGLFTVPQDWDYYKEFRGFYPDLWVRPLGPGGRGGVAGRQADGKPGRGAGRRRSIQPGRIKRRRLP